MRAFLLAARLAATALAFAPLPVHAQWTILPAPTSADLRGIHAVDPNIAWASGSDGTVLHTTDAGATWLLCATPPAAERLDFRGIQAFDASTAIVMSSGKGDLSRLYKTTDACKTWTLLFTNPDKDGFWDAFVAAGEGNDLELLVVGDPVDGRFATFQSTYGATKLGKFGGDDLKARPGEALFAASNSAFLVRTEDLVAFFGTGGPAGSRLFRTCEPCAHPNDTMTSRPMPMFPKSSSGGVFSLAARSNGARVQMVAVGGDYKRPEDGKNAAALSSDYGFTWHPAQTPPHGFRSAVAYDPAAKSWITVGPNGTDLSTDDGRNWHPLRPTPTDAANADRDWNALSLPYVVGPHGRIGKLNSLPKTP